MSTRRFHGLDLIRLVSFFAIATFHVSLIHYHTPAIDIAEQSVVIKATEQISRLLSFSGFTICFLTAILTAYSGNRVSKRIRLFTFLFGGWLVFSWLVTGLRGEALVWDIYPLIFLGVLLGSLAELAGPRVLTVVGLAGFSMLWVPWWQFIPADDPVTDVHRVFGLVGSCDQGSVEWPIFPWLGLVWAGYAVGAFTRGALRMARGRHEPLAMTRAEGGVWAALLIASVPYLGSFYQINLGSYFACEAYRQDPPVFWAHFVWPVFLIRLAFVPQVEAWLARRRLPPFVSRLAVSRKFWLAYITNYLLAHVLSFLVTSSGVEQTSWNVPTIALIAVFFVPLTELVVRAELLLAERIVALTKGLNARLRAQSPTGERGAGLIAVILALSVLGLSLSALTSYLGNRIEERKIRNMFDGRTLAYDMLRVSAGSPDALLVSTAMPGAGNNALERCVFGGGCSATSAAAPVAFNLYTAFASAPASAQRVQLSSQGQNAPGGRYTSRGLRAECAPGPTCPYWARTWFWAQCPGNAASCNAANMIFVRTQMQTHTAADLRGGRQVNKFPLDQVFVARPDYNAIGVTTSDIRQTGMLHCPAGAYSAGTDNRGIPTCKCRQMYEQTGVDPATNMPVCTAVYECPPNTAFVGMTREGAPICNPTSAYVCDDLTQYNRGNARCPGPRDKMRRVVVGAECEVIGNEVRCPDLKISCCRKP